MTRKQDFFRHGVYQKKRELFERNVRRSFGIQKRKLFLDRCKQIDLQVNNREILWKR